MWLVVTVTSHARLVTSLQHNLVDRHGEQQADVVRARAHLWHSGALLAAWAKVWPSFKALMVNSLPALGRHHILHVFAPRMPHVLQFSHLGW